MAHKTCQNKHQIQMEWESFWRSESIENMDGSLNMKREHGSITKLCACVRMKNEKHNPIKKKYRESQIDFSFQRYKINRR